MRAALYGGLMLAASLAAPGNADDSGCGKFAWPLTRDRTLLAAAEKPEVNSGETVVVAPNAAITVRLTADNAAKFAMPPERQRRTELSNGGIVMLPAPVKPGLHQITLSDDAWVDVIQNGAFVRSAGSTGRADCPGLRKSIRLVLTAAPLILQFSGVLPPSISFTIAPVE